MAAAQVELNNQLQNDTSAILTNQTVANMQLIKSHSWSGTFASPGLPNNIPSRGGVARFTHLKGNQGSKAAVIYTITNAAGFPGAIILGWSAPANFNPYTSPNRVFGAVGPRAVIDSMTWDQIQMLLDNGGSSVEIKTVYCVNATILNKPTTKKAELRANFDYCPKP